MVLMSHMKKIVFVILALGLSLNGSVVFGEGLSSHDIIQRIASEGMVLQAHDKLSFYIPQGWIVQAQDNQKYNFRVPYHLGVGGFIQVKSQSVSIETILSELTSQTKIEFIELSKGEFLATNLIGSLHLYTGRFGGEVWHFLVITALRVSGEQVIFFAQAPATWFGVYELLFMDIARVIA